MAVPLSPEAIAFINEKVIAHVATLMKDGSPQVTPVWVETDGKDILINTSLDRQKWRNLKRDPRIALSIAGADNARRTMTVRGRVIEMTTAGANDQINRLSLKYSGNPVYQRRQEGERVTVRIEPLSVRARV